MNVNNFTDFLNGSICFRAVGNLNFVIWYRWLTVFTKKGNAFYTECFNLKSVGQHWLKFKLLPDLHIWINFLSTNIKSTLWHRPWSHRTLLQQKHSIKLFELHLTLAQKDRSWLWCWSIFKIPMYNFFLRYGEQKNSLG